MRGVRKTYVKSPQKIRLFRGLFVEARFVRETVVAVAEPSSKYGKSVN
jgi:hypothetical protein